MTGLFAKTIRGTKILAGRKVSSMTIRWISPSTQGTEISIDTGVQKFHLRDNVRHFLTAALYQGGRLFPFYMRHLQPVPNIHTVPIRHLKINSGTPHRCGSNLKNIFANFCKKNHEISLPTTVYPALSINKAHAFHHYHHHKTDSLLGLKSLRFLVRRRPDPGLPVDFNFATASDSQPVTTLHPPSSSSPSSSIII